MATATSSLQTLCGCDRAPALRRRGPPAATLLLASIAMLALFAMAAPVRAEVPQSLLYFFPSECPTANRTCCPTTNDLTCGGTVRGTCQALFDTDDVCVASEDENMGQWWVTTFFDKGCVCNGNYYGVGCESCKPGYYGDDCTKKSATRVRRDFASLSDDDKQYAIDAFVALKNTPAPYHPELNWFDYIAGSHYWAMKGEANVDWSLFTSFTRAHSVMDPGHDGPASPVFHRRMVFEIERAIRIAINNDSWAMPYWNWTSTPGNQNDEVLTWFGGDGTVGISEVTGQSCRWFPPTLQATDQPAGCDCLLTEGPFANWSLIGLWGNPTGKTLARAAGCQTRFAVSPPSQQVNDFLATVPFFYTETNSSYSFRQLLGGGALGYYSTWPNAEGTADMHKRVHRWLGGTMVGNSTASDPIFYMLHSFADLVMERWIRNAEVNGWLTVDNSWPESDMVVSQNRGDCTAPYLPLVKHIDLWTNSENLGFTYDFFSDCEAAGRTDCGVATFTDFTYPDDSFMGANTVDEGATVPENVSLFFSSDCSSGSTTCCPSYDGSVCGGTTRGLCASPIGDSSVCDVTEVGLAGLWWLTSSYEKVCMCNGNYWGAACGECRPGYEGDDCETQSTTLVRRDFNSITDAEKQLVNDAFVSLKSMAHPQQPGISAYDYLVSLTIWWKTVGASGSGVGDMSTSGTHGAYSGPGTLTAHRRLLLEVESLLRLATGNDTLTLPYWKWDTSMSNDNDATLRWFGGDGKTDASSPEWECRQPILGAYNCNCTLFRGSFKRWSLVTAWGEETEGSALTRGFGCLSAAPTLPVEDSVNAYLSMPAYHATSAAKSFWKALSGQKSSAVSWSLPVSDYAAWDLDGHARVMMWLAGTQMTVSAASDPLYFLHLAYADLLFEKWIRAAIAGDYYDTWASSGLDAGHNLNECVPGFYPLQTNANLFKKSSTMGYTYDLLVSSTSSLSSSSSSKTVLTREIHAEAPATKHSSHASSAHAARAATKKTTAASAQRRLRHRTRVNRDRSLEPARA